MIAKFVIESGNGEVLVFHQFDEIVVQDEPMVFIFSRLQNERAAAAGQDGTGILRGETQFLHTLSKLFIIESKEPLVIEELPNLCLLFFLIIEIGGSVHLSILKFFIELINAVLNIAVAE